MIKIICLAAGLLLAAATAAHAGERNMTCRGEFLLYRGLGGHDVDTRTVGSPETRLCYLRRTRGEELVDTACQTELPCIIHVRATPRDTPNGMPLAWNALRIYSARPDVPLPRKRRWR
jgi:hypothetical protein